MGHQGDLADLAAGAQAPPRGFDRVGQEAGAVHAGVDLQPDVDRRGERRRLQHAQLGLVVHDQPQAVGGGRVQFGSFEHALEQQDRADDAGRAQLQRLFQERDGEAVGFAGERPSAAHGAVAVGVRLDHRERPAAVAPAGEAVVVTEGVEVDQGAGGAHGGIRERQTGMVE